jgi:hypothetical protein
MMIPVFPCRDSLTASEALYGFVGWITTRQQVVTAGGSEDCAPWVDLIQEFIVENDLSQPRADWPIGLRMPK